MAFAIVLPDEKAYREYLVGAKERRVAFNERQRKKKDRKRSQKQRGNRSNVNAAGSIRKQQHRVSSEELAADVERFRQAGGQVKECEPGPDQKPVVDYYAKTGIGRFSFVYFIQAGRSGPIKIGVAYDPQARLCELHVGNHEELRLVGVNFGTPVEEKKLHRMFAAHHIRGEWFHPSAELVAFYLGGNKRLAEYMVNGGYDEIERLA